MARRHQENELTQATAKEPKTNPDQGTHANCSCNDRQGFKRAQVRSHVVKAENRSHDQEH